MSVKKSLRSALFVATAAIAACSQTTPLLCARPRCSADSPADPYRQAIGFQTGSARARDLPAGLGLLLRLCRLRQSSATPRRLADMYSEGTFGVPRDLTRAQDYYLKAANLGDRYSMICVALNLEQGVVAPADLVGAEQCVSQSGRRIARRGNGGCRDAIVARRDAFPWPRPGV